MWLKRLWFTVSLQLSILFGFSFEVQAFELLEEYENVEIDGVIYHRKFNYAHQHQNSDGTYYTVYVSPVVSIKLTDSFTGPNLVLQDSVSFRRIDQKYNYEKQGYDNVYTDEYERLSVSSSAILFTMTDRVDLVKAIVCPWKIFPPGVRDFDRIKFFANFPNLLSIEGDDSSIKDGLIGRWDNADLVFVPRGLIVDGSYTVPKGIHKISSTAFMGCSNLKKLVAEDTLNAAVLPDAVRDIYVQNSMPFYGRFYYTDSVFWVEDSHIDNYNYETRLWHGTWHVPSGSGPKWREWTTLGCLVVEGNGPDNRISAFSFCPPTSSDLYYNYSYVDYDGDGILDRFGRFGIFGNFGNSVFLSDNAVLDTIKYKLDVDDYSIVPNRGGKDWWFLSSTYNHVYLFNQTTRETKDWGYVVAGDINNDGLMDIVNKKSDGYPYPLKYSAHLQRADGSFINSKIIVEDSETQKDTYSAYPFGSLRDNMFIDDSPSPFTQFTQMADLNGDGIADLIDQQSGQLMSYGAGQYYKQNLAGQVIPYDLNGDGGMDYVRYDKSNGELYAIIINADGRISANKLFTNKSITNLLCRDFDHDGDVDVMAFIEGATFYFVFFRNDGNNVYKKKESAFSTNNGQKASFLQCLDIDADGKYEIITNHDDLYDRIYTINRDFSVTPNLFSLDGIWGGYLSPISGYEYGNLSSLQFTWVDLDNDGIMDYIYNGFYLGHNHLQTKRNEAPSRMEKPSAIYHADKDRICISWPQGKDVETPDCDLSYELRIGTTPGGDDILYGASLPDGRRRTMNEGNMGHARKTLFDASHLSEGDYYISVQAIDAGGLGGGWSENCVYHHEIYAPAIQLSSRNIGSGDTLFAYVNNIKDDASYEWSADNANLIEQTSNGAKFVFNKRGPQEVQLTMHYNGVDYCSVPQELYINSYASQNDYFRGLQIDFNQDGYPDLVHVGKLFSNNGKGNLELLKKSFNADLKAVFPSVLDYDMDGYPDFRYWDSSSGNTMANVMINSGEQDFEFESLQTAPCTQVYYNKTFRDTWTSPFDPTAYCDFNNDGYLDCSVGKTIGINQKDNQTYIEIETDYCDSDGNLFLLDYKDSYEYVRFYDGTDEYRKEDDKWVDWNRDGYLDLVQLWMSTDKTHPKYVWTVAYQESTGSSEVLSLTDKQIMYKVELARDYWNFAIYGYLLCNDYDNDGFMDLGYIWEDSIDSHIVHVSFIKGQEQLPYVSVMQDIRIRYNNQHDITPCQLDYDNNGFVDIYLSGGVEDYVVYLNSGFNYELRRESIDHYYQDFSFIPLKPGGYILGVHGANSAIANSAPLAPASVSAKQTDKGMVISWADAIDDVTPAAQMRYNVSVKRKGKTGPGSFVISPMNGLKDTATPVSNFLYKQSTTMTVPLDVLTVGETYEIQVQAIDLWNEHSPMTAPVEITIGEGGYIDLAEQVAVGKETSVRYVGAQTSDLSCQPGDGGSVVTSIGDGSFIVKWTSPGVKNVTVGGLTTQITVVNPVEVNAIVPAGTLAGAYVAVTIPEEMAKTPNCGLSCDDLDVSIVYEMGNTTVWVLFPEEKQYTLTAFCNDEIRGASKDVTVNITATMPRPTLQRVDCGEGGFVLKWDASGLPSGITHTIIYKEGNSLGTFYNIGSASASAGSYTDYSSSPEIVSNRYAITFWANGTEQESELSKIHRPMHVMLNVAAQGGYNLMWDAYEGLVVDNYKIWRGSSPETMTVLAQVAGSQQSYSDFSPLSGNSYYAVSFSPSSVNNAKPGKLTAVSSSDIRSNAVSTANAIRGTLATSVKIQTVTENPALTDDLRELQLYYILLPAYAVTNRVAWTIVEGGDLAYINGDGLLTGKSGAGTVKVRVSTLDGSNLADEINIPVSIDASPLTVKATNYTITYGDALPVFGFEIENPNGITVTGQPVLACEATSLSPVGTYPITISKGSLKSNNLTLESGTLTILPADLENAVVEGLVDVTKDYIEGQRLTPSTTGLSVKVGSSILPASDYVVKYRKDGKLYDVIEVIGRFETVISASSSNVTGEKATSAIVNVQYPLTLTSSEWATFYGPFDIEKPSGYTVYTVENINGQSGVVTFKRIAEDYIPARTATLLQRGSDATEVDFHLNEYVGAETTNSNEGFMGVTQATPVASLTDMDGVVLASPAQRFILVGDSFVETKTGTIPANRCYLYIVGGARQAKKLSIHISDNPTDIVTITEDAEDRWFDLLGNPIEEPHQEGLYIRNGVKVFIKK